MGFQCKYCKLLFSTSALYCEHSKVHSVYKKFTIPCCFCKRNLSSATSFESHVSRFHRDAREKPTVPPCQVKVPCPVTACCEAFDTRSAYMKHVSKHLESKEGEEKTSFKCCLGTCQTVFSDKRKHQLHMYRDHPAATFGGTSLAALPETSTEETFSETNAEGTSHAFDNLEGMDTIGEENVNNEETEEIDPFPEYVVKDEIAKFYLKLEGVHAIPTVVVQEISTEIKKMSEFSHYFLKKSLKEALSSYNVSEEITQAVVGTTFKSDPVFNVHHKNEDSSHMATHHLRKKFWHSRFPYVSPKEIYFGLNEAGKKRVAQYVPIRDTLTLLLKDPDLKEMVLKSFDKGEGDPSVLSDYTDGSAYKHHQTQHSDGKCIQIHLFQDAFAFNPFGPSTGDHKPIGFYYSVGNLPSEYRTKLDLIQLVYLVLEKDTQPTRQEVIDGEDVLKRALKPLLDELKDLKLNGIEINGEKIPVCLMFMIGDNLGQHTMGGYVRSFSAHYFCRFCPISKEEFNLIPYEVKPWRTPDEYDQFVEKASKLHKEQKAEAIAAAKKKALQKAREQAEKVTSRGSAPASKSLIKTILSKHAMKKVCGVNFKGVKYHPSPFNSELLNFHVASPAQVPCVGHDLFEGIFKYVTARVLNYFITVKKYFDLPCLNRRIKKFKCQGRDKHDPPKPLKSLDELCGNAVQNWNFIRLLPFIISDLIKDKQDPVWQLFLKLKEITEYVAAPKITFIQVAYLKTMIREFISTVKLLEKYFAKCFIPKLHGLAHIADLIAKVGPLLQLGTLRYETFHIQFKRYAHACRSFINITSTLANKYMCKYAFDHSTGLLCPDVIHLPGSILSLSKDSFSPEELSCLPANFSWNTVEFLSKVLVKGTSYEIGYYLVLDSSEASNLIVGRISHIMLDELNEVSFLLEEKEAVNSFNGYYKVEDMATPLYRYQRHKDLCDYYPLPIYQFLGASCLTLKHSVICM
ncbi:uncharacterized protein LOC117639894 [Thrips palmi]|uniref:Uncharacterized protein LOC117639894 n=1 Tax=Thrips palmi TaxID=161013 RepID=A0A6P8Y5H9_THRPL|nr:uncharacterized protein LOC117639894 [Thrips palmi]XP_034231744.1 uncharacterized protein LOC117639894 [Thrips palmi]XP_034231745.1 uncharacterized protein LOC117639894 [Thrips palmi]XP_034231746.1 uncharacterized protein LOC117639894 [Thrips palmi]XP_034231747.1 uncharacterized protein LOC117639894 [Thrips palmi]XP_034231749.1 uncharacterized protein LOC117639894 [Thrips palmi]XP_034231750.1 uncharacterized protein LOC117639894 [Thrips palmi]XP_034231751.1 uncharacterized protein LOC1176